MLEEAQRLVDGMSVTSVATANDLALFSQRTVECALRWFAMPSEAHALLKRGKNTVDKDTSHLIVGRIPGTLNLLPFFTSSPCVAACPVVVGQSTVDKQSATAEGASSTATSTASADSNGLVQSHLITPLANGIVSSDPASETPAHPQSLASPSRSEDMGVAGVGSARLPKEVRVKLFPEVPKSLMRQAGSAIRDYEMIKDGDRVLLGLSGGKDSLTLLHILLSLQKRAPIRFELAAVTMNPQFPGFDPSPLVGYMKSLGIPYFFESQPLLDLATSTNPVSICAWCSRMKSMMEISIIKKSNEEFFFPFSTFFSFHIYIYIIGSICSIADCKPEYILIAFAT